jgi:hypothetical protein
MGTGLPSPGTWQPCSGLACPGGGISADAAAFPVTIHGRNPPKTHRIRAPPLDKTAAGPRPAGPTAHNLCLAPDGGPAGSAMEDIVIPKKDWGANTAM